MNKSSYPPLNLPPVDLKIKEQDGHYWVWDLIRQKYIKLTPEEYVRQSMILYLIEHRDYPKGLFSVEKKVDINGISRRTDAVVHDKQGQPKMILEFKAPKVHIEHESFLQIAAYNMKLQVDYLLLSNGKTHYCFYLNKETKKMDSLSEIPSYSELK